MNVPGRYRIAARDVTTESFEIGSRIMDEAVWKVINFLYRWLWVAADIL
jgi:hypothetical protein